MIDLALTAIAIGFLSACIGCVHSLVLWNENIPVLNYLYQGLTWMEQHYPRLAKPFGACVLCFSGQLALWTAVCCRQTFDVESVYLYIASAGVGIIFAQYLSKAWENS